MNNIEYWIELSKVLIPVLAVLLAGVFALFNLRHSIKLQAKNKWKEDFRLHMAEYLESYIQLTYLFIEWRAQFSNSEPTNETRYKVQAVISEVISRFKKIELMLGEDEYSQELLKIVSEHDAELSQLQKGEIPETDLAGAISQISQTAKNIYENKK